MRKSNLYRALTLLIAAVWLINGLYCKVLHGVPRHEAIVARILSEEHSGVLTTLIGLAEIGMALWVLSGIRVQLNTLVQIILIASMNMLEVALVPDLLLWGKLNAVFAGLLIILIYVNGFVLREKMMPSIKHGI